MTKVRAVLAGLMLGVLVALTVPTAVAAAAPAASVVLLAQAGPVAEQTTAPPGPRIDPADNDRANAAKTKSKIVVGVLAAILAVIVLWGRSVRKKRRKKSSDQAKGK
ncbi:MAG TPA: hypothetical protein VHC18_13585 [Amycolatopsis sp.]|nr:hypothetical protein [Amycolatopsis sp.]